MILHLKITGTLFILLALMHIALPRYFSWSKELSAISLISRQILYVHTFFIAFIVLLMGLLCLCCAEDLINTTLGNRICLGLGLFWLTRLYFQFFVYSPQVWRGKGFETSVHVIFSALWIYFTAVFLLVYYNNMMQ